LQLTKKKKSTILLLLVGFGIPAYFVYELTRSNRIEMKTILVYLNSGNMPKQTRALDSFESYANEAYAQSSAELEKETSPEKDALRSDLDLIVDGVVKVCTQAKHEQVLIRCGWSFQHFSSRPQVRDMLIGLITPEQAKMVRYNAALALARKGDVAAKPVLITMLSSARDRKIRYSAAVQLHQVTGDNDIESIRTLIYTERDPRIKNVLSLLLERLEGGKPAEVPDARR
jgi:hypothetical protein